MGGSPCVATIYMIKREAKFQTKFGHWLRAVYLPQYAGGAFELKQTTKDSIAFSSVKTHQITALRVVKHGHFYYKIADDSVGTKPFDCVGLSGLDAFIVIKYPDGFVLIDVDVFILEEKRSKRRSLTYARAKAIATITVI